jgi:hypothetical protein
MRFEGNDKKSLVRRPTVERRDFIKDAAVAVVGTTLGASVASANGTLARLLGNGEPKTGSSYALRNNRQPLRPMAFAKLSINSFEPGGWVRVALERQRDGMIGHMPEISWWLAKENNGWLSRDGKGESNWEEVPYWLRGYSRIGYLLNDPAMIKESRIWIESVFNSQRENGEFGPSHHGEKGNPDVWHQMPMLQALQYWYEYSQDPRVILCMRRFFQWQLATPEDQFLKEFWENARGGDNLASVYWLYNITGDSFLLDLATKIDRNTANWRQKDNVPTWHVVNIAQGFRAPATYYPQSGDKADLEASYNNFKLVREMYGHVPGGMFCADENARPGYTDPHQGTELCAMVEEVWSNGMMLCITGDTLWAENTETVAFNTMPAAFMADYRGIRYLTCPNIVDSDSKDHKIGFNNEGPFWIVMNPLSHRCCQHNCSSSWANFVEHSWMATPDDGLAAQLYSEGSVRARVGASGAEVKLHTTTRYPFEDKVEIEVHAPQAVDFPLWLRIPPWAHAARVLVNGQPQSVEAKPGAYARVARSWRNGDRVSLQLPMNVRLQRWYKNKNSASVSYGPLTFALKINEQYETVDSTKTVLKDSRWQKTLDTSKWPGTEIHPRSEWNYGLALRDTNPEQAFAVSHKPWPADGYPFTNTAAPIEIKAHGKQIPQWKLDENGLCAELPQSPVQTDRQETSLTLVPMGGARLRISSFPVVS